MGLLLLNFDEYSIEIKIYSYICFEIYFNQKKY